MLSKEFISISDAIYCQYISSFMLFKYTVHTNINQSISPKRQKVLNFTFAVGLKASWFNNRKLVCGKVREHCCKVTTKIIFEIALELCGVEIRMTSDMFIIHQLVYFPKQYLQCSTVLQFPLSSIAGAICTTAGITKR